MLIDRKRMKEAWRRRAACAGLDPRWWHPEEGSWAAENEHALWICNNTCPVREACLDDAVKHNETRGIWGGMTARARTLERRRRKRAEKRAG